MYPVGSNYSSNLISTKINFKVHEQVLLSQSVGKTHFSLLCVSPLLSYYHIHNTSDTRCVVFSPHQAFFCDTSWVPYKSIQF